MVKLRNGVTLSDILRKKSSGDGMTKAAARDVFNGTADTVHCVCLLTYDKKESCCNGRDYSIVRVGKSIAVGCVRFTPLQVAAVKRWLKRA